MSDLKHISPFPHLAYFDAKKESVFKKIPGYCKREKFESSLRTAFFESAKLLSTTSVESFFLSVCSAAELGLCLSKTIGHAHLVPFKGICTMVIGYRGLIFLAHRSNLIRDVNAYVVYQGQEFDVANVNGNWEVKHKPMGEISTKDEHITHVYAWVEMSNGSKKFAMMTKDQINEIKFKSPLGNSGPWRNDFAEMAKKTVIRRIFKTLPMDPDCELHKALKIDNEEYTLKTPYREALADAGIAQEQERESMEKKKSRDIMLKYLTLAEKKGISLPKSKDEILSLNDQDLEKFLISEVEPKIDLT